MAEKSKEELLDELIRRARLSVGKLTKGEACAGEYAAVLARMAGPGEVVVPKEPTEAMIGAADAAIRQRAYHGPMSQVAALHEAYGSFIAARPQGEGK